MKKEKIPYVRIGTSYFKRSLFPTISGDKIETLIRWSVETIKQDEGKDYLSHIPKYDGFICYPDHINYKLEYENYYNTYNPLSSIPEKGSINYTMLFLKHIFGKQINLGLDYLQLLYTNPTQTLPILCLVSHERATGKSTFLKWLRFIFESNLTYLTNSDFASQFNSDWANKLLICIDEVLFKTEELTERIKYLSTTNINKMEAKGRDKVEVFFFSKFILCSNNERTFIKIDIEETRFWVIKVPKIEKEDTQLLHKLKTEIPAFLDFMLNRELNVPKPLTRMWFSREQIRTKALVRLFNYNNQKVEIYLLEAFYELFQEIPDEVLNICPKDILLLMEKKKQIEAKDIRRVLKEWGFQPKNNSETYTIYHLTFADYHSVKRRGRYYTISKSFILSKYDALMQE